MKGAIRISFENIDEPHEAIGREHDNLTWPDLCLEPQLAPGPRAERAHDPVAIRPIEPGPVLENLASHGRGDETRLMLLSSQGGQCLLLEWLRPLIRPPDDSIFSRHEGDHIAQEAPLNPDALALPRLHADQAETG